MIAHQQKKLSEEDLRAFRESVHIPVNDDDIARLPFRKPDASSDEGRYLRERPHFPGRLVARQTQGSAAAGRTTAALDIRSRWLEGTGEREISTTMAFVRILTIC